VTLGVHRAVFDDLPVFVHVLGAMALVGSLLLVATALLMTWRRDDEAEVVALTRLAFRTLFALVLPSYIVMRVGAQWADTKLPESQEDSPWIAIGYITSDLGALLLLVSLVLAGIWLRRRRGRVFGRIVGVMSALLIVAYLVAVWAMTTKVGA